MRKQILLLVLTSFLLLASSLGLIMKPALAQAYVIGYPQEAKMMIDSNPSLIVLDVRNQTEYDAGHIRNAILVPIWNLTQNLDKLNKSDPILVYCKAGTRSNDASEILVSNGFTQIFNFIGGITAWALAGYPEYVKYASIQEAINNATEGGTLFISNGLYSEHLTISKPLTLIGENKYRTIVDGSNSGTIVRVQSNNVSISEFTVQRPGCSCEDSYGIRLEDNHSRISITNNEMMTDSVAINATGVQDVIIAHNDFSLDYVLSISIFNSSDIQITRNNMTGFMEGVAIENSSNITFSDNILVGTGNPGVFAQNCSSSLFRGNTFLEDSYGIVLKWCNENLLYDNNFEGNFRDTSCQNSTNSWDNGIEGNFWSNFTTIDLNFDGISDTPYLIDASTTDNHPLTGTFASYEVENLEIECISNSSVTEPSLEFFNSTQATVAFNVTGQDGTQGFARLCIPRALINGSFTVMFDEEVIQEPRFHMLPESNAESTYIYLNYTHSEHTIEISGTTTIPEFPLAEMLAVLFLATTFFALIQKRKKLLTQGHGQQERVS